jgi:glycopeptide antibiotics resistance protein
MENQVSWPQPARDQWSNRLLIGSLVGIGYLTLFPFRFDFSIRHASYASPFLLGPSLKVGGPSDFFLNALLFVPFGFAISSRLYQRGAGWTRMIVWAFAGGALTSYIVEVLQFYIPTRSSAWDDVTPNSLGALTGFVLFALFGKATLRRLSRYEGIMRSWLSPLRATILVVVYFGIWFGVSIPLQQQTRLTKWDPQCGLLVGNDASGERAWKGHVSRLQVWNRAIPERLVVRMTAGVLVPDSEQGLLASYDFTTPGPYPDQKKFLPELVWISTNRSLRNDAQPQKEIDGASWLGTEIPVGELTRKIQDTNQFTVRIDCIPAGIQGTDGRIVSISQSAENVNLHLRQEGTNLVLWFRNPLSETRSVLAWYVPGVFEAGQRRDIVATYDGSDAFIYLDGKKAGSYRLSAGASLAHEFIFISTVGLDGYVIDYETLIFLPAGLLIGMAVGKWSNWNTGGKLLLAADLLLPSVLLELLLAGVSGRGILAGNIILSLLLSIAAVCLINADGRVREPSPTFKESLQA